MPLLVLAFLSVAARGHAAKTADALGARPPWTANLGGDAGLPVGVALSPDQRVVAIALASPLASSVTVLAADDGHVLRKVPAPDGTYLRAVAVADDGSLTVAGATPSPERPSEQPGGSDAIVVRYRPNGTRAWTRTIGAAGFGLDQALALAVDRRGGVVVAGATTGGLDAATAAGGRDAFLARVTSDGRTEWVRQFGSAGDDWATGAALTRSGRVVVSAVAAPSAPGGWDGLVAAFDGTWRRWTRTFGTTGYEQANAIAVDRDDGIYVVGLTNGTLTTTGDGPGIAPGGAPQPPMRPEAYDATVVRFSSTGTRLWARQFGTSTRDVAHAVAPHPAGGVVAVGDTAGSLDGAPRAHQSGDGFAARLTSAGVRVVTRQLRAVDAATAVAVDDRGRAYVAGTRAPGAVVFTVDL